MMRVSDSVTHCVVPIVCVSRFDVPFDSRQRRAFAVARHGEGIEERVSIVTFGVDDFVQNYQVSTHVNGT